MKMHVAVLDELAWRFIKTQPIKKAIKTYKVRKLRNEIENLKAAVDELKDEDKLVVLDYLVLMEK